jgi:hypothetical protein
VSRDVNPAEIELHLDLLLTGMPKSCALALWTPRGRRSYYYGAADHPRADAEKLAQQGDVYVSVSAVDRETARKLGQGRRPAATDAGLLTALTVDLDVIGTPDGRGGVKQRGAPTLEAAVRAAELVAPPTMIVATGGGAQAWHMFDRPLAANGPGRGAAPTRLLRRWQQLHRDLSGFHIDSTHDLARLARVAGTRNYKGGGDGAPVRLVYADGVRYSPLELAEHVAGVEIDRPKPAPVAPAHCSNGHVDLGDDRDLLDRAFAARNGPKVQALYAGDLSAYGGDHSAADLALCSALAFWTNDPDRIDALFRGSGLMRPKWDSARGESTYGRMTLEVALAGRTDSYSANGGRDSRRTNTSTDGGQTR